MRHEISTRFALGLAVVVFFLFLFFVFFCFFGGWGALLCCNYIIYTPVFPRVVSMALWEQSNNLT